MDDTLSWHEEKKIELKKQKVIYWKLQISKNNFPFSIVVFGFKYFIKLR